MNNLIFCMNKDEALRQNALALLHYSKNNPNLQITDDDPILPTIITVEPQHIFFPTLILPRLSKKALENERLVDSFFNDNDDNDKPSNPLLIAPNSAETESDDETDEEEIRWQCTCQNGYAGNTYSAMCAHIGRHHNTKERFQCPLCKHKSSRKRSIVHHLIRKHKVFKICCTKQFFTEEDFIKHKNINRVHHLLKKRNLKKKTK